MAEAPREGNRVTGLVAKSDLTNAVVVLEADLTRKALKTSDLEETPDTIGSGQKVVTTAGTQVQLATNTCLAVTVKALSANTGLIYVGTTTVDSATGHELNADESVDIAISNTNKVWIDSAVNGEGVSFLFVAT